MNEKLKDFLEQLNDEDANEIWDWLDSNENAVHEMIGVICFSHQHLQ